MLLAAVAWSRPTAGDSLTTVRSVLQEHKQHIFQQQTFLYKEAVKAQSTEPKIDALYYRLELDIKPATRNINGITTARFRILSAEANFIELDLNNRMEVLQINGAATGFNHNNNRLTIQLDNTYSAGEIVEVIIYYSGNPQDSRSSYFRFDEMPDGRDMVWTLSQPYGARYWWPCKDTPADKADSADIIITVPEELEVGSNGLLLTTKDNGDGTRTFHWRERYPVATYLISIAAAPYGRFQEYYHYSDTDSMLLDYYVYPWEINTAKVIFSEMHDYLDALSYYFGPYPFLEEKYGMARFGWGGAMEHQTLSSIGQVAEYWRYVYVHELGHQWFGDAVTCASWADIWLNEGFASYSEALYAEWAGYNDLPPGSDSYHAYMNTQQYPFDGTIFVQDTSLPGNIFDRIVYDKGSWVLHMLRGVINDDAIFFDILRSYVSDPRWNYGSVLTEDFQSVCEQKSGLDLTAFFDQWLFYPFFPRYEYEWQITGRNQSDYVTEVTIYQIQPTVVYQMPVQLRFEFEGGSDTTVMVQNTMDFQQYSFSLRGFPLRMQFDPDNWILKEATLRAAETFSTKIKFKNIFPNPFRSEVYINTINWNTDQPDLQIYDILGRKIKRIAPHSVSLYNHSYRWDATNEQGHRVSSGIYFIRPAGSGSDETNHQIQKIILVR